MSFTCVVAPKSAFFFKQIQVYVHLQECELKSRDMVRSKYGYPNKQGLYSPDLERKLVVLDLW